MPKPARWSALGQSMPSPSRLDRSENSPSLFDQSGLRIERGKSDQYGDAAARKIDQNYAITQSLPPARSFAIYNPCRQAAEAGFEYDSCCWGIRVVAKRFLRNRDGDHRDAIYVQLVLKGLGNVGRRSTPLFYDITY